MVYFVKKEGTALPQEEGLEVERTHCLLRCLQLAGSTGHQ